MQILKLYCWSLLLFPLIIACQKQEGCTDEAALNYDITAKVDDGSCKYCETTTDTIGLVHVFLTDENSQSIYFNEEIAEVMIVQTQTTVNDQSCGLNSCSLSTTVSNLTDHNLEELSFNGSISTGGNQFFISTSGSISVPVNSSQTLPQLNTNMQCNSIDEGFSDFYLNYVTYSE